MAGQGSLSCWLLLACWAGQVAIHLGRAAPLESAAVKRQLLVQQLLGPCLPSALMVLTRWVPAKAFAAHTSPKGPCSQSTCRPSSSAPAKAHLTDTNVDQKKVPAGMLL